MYLPFLPADSPNSNAEDSVLLSIALACEDLASALRAETLFEQIKRALGPGFEVQTSFWRFDEMEIPELKKRAKAEFAAADMIVISYRTDTLNAGLPARLEDFLPEKSAQPRALVTLQGRNENGARTRSSAEFFRDASTKAGIDFFSEAEWTHRPRRTDTIEPARFRI